MEVDMIVIKNNKKYICNYSDNYYGDQVCLLVS